MANQYTERVQGLNIGQILIRLVVSAVVLAITAAITPNFTIDNIWSLLIASVVLAVLDYAALRLLRLDASPFGRGITGFVLAAAIIYLTSYLVAGFDVTIWSAILGAFVYGIIDAIIPGKAM